MHWFKIILLVWFFFEVIECIARAGGWQPKKHNPAIYAAGAVIVTMIIVGIWFLV